MIGFGVSSIFTQIDTIKKGTETMYECTDILEAQKSSKTNTKMLYAYHSFKRKNVQTKK